MKLRTIWIAWLFLVAGCASEDLDVTVFQTKSADHTFIVEARGELLPSESINVSMPTTVNMPFNIVWLVPEYSEVSKGDVIARFDDSELSNMRSGNVLAMANQQILFDNHARMSAVARSRIAHETSRVEGETDIAETYVEVDPQLFSKHEIIDAIGQLDYLAVQTDFYGWQAETHEQRTAAETSRISAQRDATKMNLEKQDKALGVMTLVSPADGTFVYAQTPWGEKLTRGHIIYPGGSVGLLPLKGKLKAKLFVPEVDAVGLAPNQNVKIRLDSAVEEEYAAVVTDVSRVARALDRNDPRRYFTVEAKLNEVDEEFMYVGSSVSAEIITGELSDAILVPQQAVFFEEDKAFVYVIEGNQSNQRLVEVGERSPNLVEIVDGVSEGENISLEDPLTTSS